MLLNTTNDRKHLGMESGRVITFLRPILIRWKRNNGSKDAAWGSLILFLTTKPNNEELLTSDAGFRMCGGFSLTLLDFT